MMGGEMRNDQSGEVCGTCQYHRLNSRTDEWQCDNPESDCFTAYTDYTDTCQEYMRRMK